MRSHRAQKNLRDQGTRNLDAEEETGPSRGRKVYFLGKLAKELPGSGTSDTAKGVFRHRAGNRG